MKDSWLIISYFANIDAMAPSHHIDDRLPFFKKKGIIVHLLSSPCGLRRQGPFPYEGPLSRTVGHTVRSALSPTEKDGKEILV